MTGKGKQRKRQKPGRQKSFLSAPWFAASLLVVAVVIAFIPAIPGGFIWDDPRYVTENDTLRSLSGLGRIWTDIGATIQYYPLVFTTFWAEYHLWGANPLGYHVVNVLIHGLGAVLLFFILRRLSLPGAWIAAALFALHPVQVESVAWITERKNVLSGLFYMAAMLAYLRFALPGDGRGEAKDRRFYIAALVLFVLALFSKTTASSLPAAVLLILWWKRGRISPRDLLPLVPFLIIGASMGALTSWLETNSVGARGPEWEISFTQRFLIAGRALWFYLGKLVLPWRLAFNYPRWSVDAARWWQWLFPVAAIAAALLLWAFRKRIGRGPLAAALFFGGTLFPALGFIDVYPMRYSFVADHFQYIACVGVFALAAALIARHVRNTSLVAGILVFVLGALTWRQAVPYAGLEPLWRDTIAKNRSSFLAHNNLASELLSRGDTDEAIGHLGEAVRLKPDFYEARCGFGKALVERGRRDEGMAHLEKAREIRPDKPWAHIYIGDALAAGGKMDEAIESYEKAIEVDPENADARNNLANALAGSGRPEEAIELYRSAIELAPGRALTHGNMANALSEAGRFDEAIEHYREALRLEPNHRTARRNLGVALSKQGRADEAIAEFEAAIRVNPRDVVSRFHLAGLWLEKGRADIAAGQYRTIIQIDPRYTPAREALDSLEETSAPSDGR